MFIQKLDLYKITRIVLVPSLLRAIFQTIRLLGTEAKVMLNSVKLWVCSGETMTKDLVMEFFDYFPIGGHTICNFYGSTEIMGDVTFVKFSTKQEIFERSLDLHIPIGEPIYNTVIYVLDDKLNMCQMDEVGEIYVGGYNLAKGYVGVAEDPRFILNPFCKTHGFTRLYKTGDFGRVTESQGKLRTLAYEGRVDSQIKVRGQRVDLSEIEMIMNGIHLISKAKVLCYHAGLEDQVIENTKIRLNVSKKYIYLCLFNVDDYCICCVFK
jgi:non-ribosomal peptide synthetase component F